MQSKTRGIILSGAVLACAMLLVEPSLRAADAPKGHPEMSIGAGIISTPKLIRGFLQRKKPVTISGGMGRAFGYERYHTAKKSNRVQTVGEVFGNTPVYDSRRNRYNARTRFVPSRTYYDERGVLIN